MIHVIAKVRLLLILLFVACTGQVWAQQPVVKTDRGFVKGITENGITVFKGLPYAAPPTGALRFMPPAVHAAWKDTLLAQTFGQIAAQPGGKQTEGSEDCLSLNIYTPKPDNRKRAVLVWVHGGSMTAGAGKGENGHDFADKDDIVTVTINYRLGALGFMYMGDVDKRYARSGNNGLLDCIQALKWIRQNIEKFGGDPHRVTIMGESAGAKLISAVLVSPASKGLFQQYIAESGSVQCIRDTITAKNERARILTQLGLGKNDVRKLLTLPADTIMKAQAKVCAGIGGNSFFGPVYDGKTIVTDAYRYAVSGALPHIKALIGTNKYEAALFVSPEAWSKGPETVLKPLFEDGAPLVDKIYHEELKASSPYDAAVKTLTQYMYQMHSYRFAKVLAGSNIQVYMYRFDYDSGKQYGAMHAAELQYVWADPNKKNPDAEKQQLTTSLHNTWVAFIKTGNPDNAAIPQWPLYNNDTRQILSFDKSNKIISAGPVFDDKRFPSQVFSLK